MPIIDADLYGRIRDRTSFGVLSGCWNWNGNKTGRDRRAYMWHDSRTRLVSRVYYEYVLGVKLEKGVCVLHTCDNPGCVNPAHLYLGTQKDNAKDRQQRNRNRAFDRSFKGEANGASKLTAEQVIEIRKTTDVSHSTLAQRFGVSRATIGDIKRRKIWKHI